MLNQTLKSQVSKLWDKFWSGGISNPLTAIEQISYLLFMKRLDELDSKKRQDAEFTGESYKSIFDGKDENLKWRNFKQMEAGVMLKYVQEHVFPFTKSLGEGGGPFTKYMKNAVFIISKPSLLTEAVSIIDEIFEEIAKQEANGQGFQDTQGDLYEYFLSELKSAGKLGQFRTPRHIIELICELVDPKLGDTICDPACGTGGFLLGAYQHIITAHTSKEQRRTDENGLTIGGLGDRLTDERQWKHLKEKTFYGYDTDDSMVRIGVMNLMMHGISSPNIEQKDTLSKKYDEDNQYDVIMANPPFTGSIDKGDINESLSVNTTKTELLFVNRIIKSLKIGGRAGVIVPDGVITDNSSAALAVRKMLVEDTQLLGVISLPHFIFKPYASVSTNILIFVKGGETDKVWFYEIKKDGYSSGNARKYIGDSEFADVINLWKSRNEEEYESVSGKHCFVDKAAIVENGYELSAKKYLKEVFNKNGQEYISLGEIATIEKGSEPAKGDSIGCYPLITTAENARKSKTYHYDTEAILVPLVSSTGHGHASIKRIAYFRGKFAAASIMSVIQIRDKRFLPLFVYYYLLAFKEDLLVSKMKGSANVSLSISKIKDVPVPLIPIIEQSSYIDDIKKIDEKINSLKNDVVVLEEQYANSLTKFRNKLG